MITLINVWQETDEWEKYSNLCKTFRRGDKWGVQKILSKACFPLFYSGVLAPTMMTGLKIRKLHFCVTKLIASATVSLAITSSGIVCHKFVKNEEN